MNAPIAVVSSLTERSYFAGNGRPGSNKTDACDDFLNVLPSSALMK
jgi:hypothetical protein